MKDLTFIFFSLQKQKRENVRLSLIYFTYSNIIKNEPSLFIYLFIYSNRILSFLFEIERQTER